MKVVQVNYAFDAGLAGPEALLDRYHTLTGWSDAVARAGLSIAVVQAFTRDDMVERNDVRYEFRAVGSGVRSFDALHKAVVASNPDIVHVNGLDAPLQTWRLRRALPAPVAMVVQDHGTSTPRSRSLKAIVRRRAMRAADGYLFTSRDQAAPWVRDRFIRDAACVLEVLEASTVMRPVDRARSRAQSTVAGRPALLWVGRLDANKDPLTVLAGFERARAAMPDAALTMVFGADRLLPEVLERISGSSLLRGRVQLVGAVPHERLAEYYSAADLFVLGSHREGSGYALLEACACGATPVVTDIPSFRAITGNGAVGRLWEVGNAEGLAAALAAAASGDLDAGRLAVMDHFARHLNWDAVGRRARAVYEMVAARRRAAGGR